MTVDEFKEILSNGHVYRSLYHFTASENLPSIRAHGIVSKQYAADHNITIAVHGGNEWSHDADKHKGLNGFVNLCFTHSHPMCHLAQVEGRIKNPVYITVDPNVLNFEGAKITFGVANKSGVELVAVEDALARIDAEVLYTRTDWSDHSIQQRLRAAEKCEILIPNRVPIDLLKNI